MNPPFPIVIVLILGVTIFASWMLFRGVKRGTAEYSRKTVFAGAGVIVIWALFIAFHYFRHGVFYSGPGVIPFLGVFMIIYHHSLWRSLTRKNEAKS
jgi:hypothetical protein